MSTSADRGPRRRRSQPKIRIKREESPGIPEQSFTSRLLHVPVEIFFDLLSTTLRLLHPLVPYFIPLFIAAFVFPILVLFSVSAGWYVWKNVAVGWETQLYLQYGDGPVPYAEAYLPALVPAQPYDISLHLTVPASESNYALGNFMSSLTLTTPANQTLAYVRRPALVLPPSSRLPLPIPFFSADPTTTSVHLHLLSSYVSGTRNVLAKVELGRKDAWKSIGKGEGRELTVMSASLRGVVVHKGVRGLVSRYPVISASIASSIFLIASFAAFAACMLPLLASVRYDEPSSEGASKPAGLPAPATVLPEDEKPPRRRKSTRRSGSRAGRAQETTGVPESAMPPANDGASTPLRRRRSRLSDSGVLSESE
ncbi:hypothetical protein OE88DRAFT_1803584 [Heliocybe sulcata]|uniref:Adipose-regulatory protein-domain-containing protein n=1 Tax=Heliocybe sulcata TaxID=5364 RepID=A0A5C3NKF9_9AGAM|nr:hypothetical protein OE88DRAFT_1803584 [Heliocybe sulcata]